jgi:hypothetical protein
LASHSIPIPIPTPKKAAVSREGSVYVATAVERPRLQAPVPYDLTFVKLLALFHRRRAIYNSEHILPLIFNEADFHRSFFRFDKPSRIRKINFAVKLAARSMSEQTPKPNPLILYDISKINAVC